MGRSVTFAKGILLASALQAAPLQLAAQRADLTTLFPARPAGHVTDVARVLDAGSAARLEALGVRLRETTGAELAIVVLPTIGEAAAADVAVAIGRAWGVGARRELGDPRRNAGLVILLVPRREGDPNSGHIFIATGQGLEGIVTDLQAGRTRDLMRPDLSRGAYGPGLEAGAGALAALIAREMGVSDSVLARGDRLRSGNQRGAARNAVRIILPIVLIILVIALQAASTRQRGGRRRRRGGGWWWGGGFGGFGGGGFGRGGFGGGGFGGGGFGGFGGGGGFSGGGAGGRF